MSEELRKRKVSEEHDGGDGRDEDEMDAVVQPTTKATDEKKKSSVITRVVSGLSILFAFILIVYIGHLPILALVALLQIGMFYELLGVRYVDAVEKEIPHFRLLHWMIFSTAMFTVFGEDCALFLMRYLPRMEMMVRYHSYWLSTRISRSSWVSMIFYICDFVIFVLSLKKGFYKYQIGQIAWTMLTIIIVVYQVRAIVPVIAEGLVWFVLPVMTVAWNDTMAYFCGMKWGRKFINKPLTSLSPNKSWEGFIFGGCCTFIIGWIMTWMFNTPHLYCPFDQPNCPVPSFYQAQFYAFPDWLSAIIRIPGLRIQPMYVHEFFIALFASLVAPFGGFFASAIKRAYGKKDFASLIPGHGGLMDRFDCQFLMMYFVSVYYNTFVKEKVVDINKVLKMITQLTTSEKEVVLNTLQESIALNL